MTSTTAALNAARSAVYTVGGGYTIIVEDNDDRTFREIRCYEGDGLIAVRELVTVLRAAEACRLLGCDYRAAKTLAADIHGDLATRVKWIISRPGMTRH